MFRTTESGCIIVVVIVNVCLVVKVVVVLVVVIVKSTEIRRSGVAATRRCTVYQTKCIHYAIHASIVILM